MNPILKTEIVHDTYYIKEEKNNSKDRVSLVIEPIINCETNIMSWQDSTLHPKSLPFKNVTINSDTKEIEITTASNTILTLKLLTIDIFKQHINNIVPARALESDEMLRSWYQVYIQNPYDMRHD